MDPSGKRGASHITSESGMRRDERFEPSPQQDAEKHASECRLIKKVQMQGGEEARSEAYWVVRCNDERRSQRRRWAFFIAC